MNTLYCKGIVKNKYPVYLSSTRDFSDLFTLLPDTKNCFVVADDKVLELFPVLSAELERLGAHIFPIASTEDNKSLEGLMEVLKQIFAFKPNRDDIVLAIGGGLVLNLGGLAASLTMRGIRFYYVPTTLTGQIDASLGSKQAVNYAGAKNWIGTYSDPEFCYVNPNFLKTQPPRYRNSDAIEGVKLCLATDKRTFWQLYDLIQDFENLSEQQLYKFVEKMIEVKLPVVQKDLMEENYGMSMLYGHTIGHAIEMLDYTHINHGEAVGLGMLAAARISYALGLCDETVVALHKEVLIRLKVPTKIPPYIDPEAIFEKLRHNKKNYAGKIRFVLLKGVGKMAKDGQNYYTVVNDDVIRQAIKEGY